MTVQIIGKFPASFFHGTRSATIDSFDIKRADAYAPFGPAIYLTSDLEVAETYVRDPGGIYQVHWDGDEARTIALDKPLYLQSPQAVLAISCLYEEHGLALDTSSCDSARRVIDEVSRRIGKAHRNFRLSAYGIWLLHGHVDACEYSGRCDRGVQYAVILETAIKGLRRL